MQPFGRLEYLSNRLLDSLLLFPKRTPEGSLSISTSISLVFCLSCLFGFIFDVLIVDGSSMSNESSRMKQHRLLPLKMMSSPIAVANFQFNASRTVKDVNENENGAVKYEPIAQYFPVTLSQLCCKFKSFLS